MLSDFLPEYHSAMAAILACGGVGILVWWLSSVRGLTLVGPWIWTAAALLTLAVAEIAIATLALEPSGASALRLVATAGILTPGMALLGAKRPQDTAWNFVVVALWIVLALPAVEYFFLDRSGPLVVQGARAWFLVALILMGLLNYLPTRFALSALLAASSQLVAFAPWLQLTKTPPNSGHVILALGLADLAIGLAAIGVLPRRRGLAGRDRVWVDFRDAFGTLWGLRVAERVNAASTANDWGLHLGWGGFRSSVSTNSQDTAPDRARATGPSKIDRQLDQVLKNLLRRFVSPSWIDTRLGQDGSLLPEPDAADRPDPDAPA